MLDATKVKLQADILQALQDAMKATFIGATPEQLSNEISLKFAQAAAGPIADAICTFVKSADVLGTIPVTGTLSCAVGPVAGTVVPMTGNLKLV